MSVLWEKPSTAINPDICRSIEAPFADIKCYNPLQPSQKNQFEQKKKKNWFTNSNKALFQVKCSLRLLHGDHWAQTKQ